MKLHLGCGKRHIPGFVHVDLADFPHVDYRHDVRTLPMFEDESAELIYACHVLEYFDREEVEDVLAEWRRVLKPGGILRLAVPDFPVLARIYQFNEHLSTVLGPLYGRWEVEPGRIIYHCTVYDFDSLSGVLYEAGFRYVVRWDWRS